MLRDKSRSCRYVATSSLKRPLVWSSVPTSSVHFGRAKHIETGGWHRQPAQREESDRDLRKCVRRKTEDRGEPLVERRIGAKSGLAHGDASAGKSY